MNTEREWPSARVVIRVESVDVETLEVGPTQAARFVDQVRGVRAEAAKVVADGRPPGMDWTRDEDTLDAIMAALHMTYGV